jgi:hypothetical protein
VDNFSTPAEQEFAMSRIKAKFLATYPQEMWTTFPHFPQYPQSKRQRSHLSTENVDNFSTLSTEDNDMIHIVSPLSHLSTKIVNNFSTLSTVSTKQAAEEPLIHRKCG